MVGFVALKLHPDHRMGEISMIAVDPDFQRRGVATRLTSERLIRPGAVCASVLNPPGRFPEEP